MSLRTGVVTVIAVLCLGTFAILMLIVPSSSPQSRTTSSSIRQLQSTLDKQIEIPNSLDQRKLPSSLDTQREILTSLKDQRDDLSRQLNELRQKMGRIDCEASLDKKTNEVGGWCRNASLETGGEHITDANLVKSLSKFFKGKTVGSFGDGPGAYKRDIEKLGEVKLYDAYDGAPFCEETSEGRVKFLDLTVPHFGMPVYDWIISLEVAEHIPDKFESIYIGNLVRHCREGIVMSWAGPGQTGLAHINRRPREYAINVIEQHGFVYNETASQQLCNAAIWAWLQDNIIVFVRQNTTSVNILEEWYA